MIEWNAKGITRAQADGRYVKRYVGTTLTADTIAVTNSAGATENVLTNPGGAVMGGIPLDADPSLLAAGRSGRFALVLDVLRPASSFASLRVSRFNGTWQVPTQVTANQQVGEIAFGAYDGSGLTTIGAIKGRSRENISPTARGAEIRFETYAIGETVGREVFGFSVAPNISSITGLQSAFRFIPLVNGLLRNPSDTATLIEWNATGLGFFGTAPIAKPTVTGAKGGNAALTSLLAQLAALGLITDSTT